MNECNSLCVFGFFLTPTECTISVFLCRQVQTNNSPAFHKLIVCVMLRPQTPASLKSEPSHKQPQQEQFTFQLFSFIEQTLQMRGYLKLAGYNLHCISLNKNICIIKSKIK